MHQICSHSSFAQFSFLLRDFTFHTSFDQCELMNYKRFSSIFVSFFALQVLTFEDSHSENEENSLTHMDHGFHSKLPPGILPHGLPTVKEVAPAITPQEEKKEEKKESKCRLSHRDK